MPSQLTSALPQVGQREGSQTAKSLLFFGYRVDRLLINIKFQVKIRSFMGIVMRAETATNTQPAASPRREQRRPINTWLPNRHSKLRLAQKPSLENDN